jgi:cobalt/nickel transport system permease protein
MLSFVSILLKTLLTVLAVLLLIATTPYTEINHQLVRMGMPKILGLQFIMTYRYITVLLGEAAAMFSAYLLRAPDRKGLRMGDMGSFLGQLLLRSFDRAERVYQAMKCRGFDGMYRGKTGNPFRVSDFFYTAILIFAVTGLRFFNTSLFLGGLFGRLVGILW